LRFKREDASMRYLIPLLAAALALGVAACADPEDSRGMHGASSGPNPNVDDLRDETGQYELPESNAPSGAAPQNATSAPVTQPPPGPDPSCSVPM
jgi:hypothetical protein